VASLTLRRLRAIGEALTQRLAGELDGGIPRGDYEAALEWAGGEMARRTNRAPKSLPEDDGHG
jgi:hypothetical protein